MIQMDSASDSSFDASHEHSTEETSNSDILNHQRMVPTNPRHNSIPIPSQQILDKDEYKNIFKKRQFQYTEGGSLILNSHNLKLLCMKEGLYEFPELNNKLYLHFKCIQKIEGLGEYVNLKTLYMESNVIRKIQNLECLPNIQNLFLQNNMIDVMENLSALTNLKVLNLSYNNIFKIEGLSSLVHLQNLMITNNNLENFESVENLGQCSAELTSIDLSNNRIQADERLFDLVPQIKCIYLTGNPLVREVTHYRRTVIGKLKNLLYLDQRTVNEEERMIAERWLSDGDAGVKKIRQEIQDRRKQKKEEQRKDLMKDINKHRARKLNLFRSSIRDLQQEISKLTKFKDDPANQNMVYYYETNIKEKQDKIEELENFIANISGRIEGKPAPKKQSIIQSQKSMSGVDDIKRVEDPQYMKDPSQIKDPSQVREKVQQIPLLNNQPIIQQTAQQQTQQIFQREMAKYRKDGQKEGKQQIKDPLGFDEIQFVESIPIFGDLAKTNTLDETENGEKPQNISLSKMDMEESQALSNQAEETTQVNNTQIKFKISCTDLDELD